MVSNSPILLSASFVALWDRYASSSETFTASLMSAVAERRPGRMQVNRSIICTLDSTIGDPAGRA